MTRIAQFGLALALSAGPLLAQTAAENDREDIPARNDVSVEKMLDRAEDDRMAARANDKISRVALEQWAGCVARSNPGEASRILTMDFTSPRYSRAMQGISQESRTCIQFRGTLRSGGLLFAGEMAEALLERGDESPRSALAQAAAAPAPNAFSFTDKIAICSVRSSPDDVAALFATARDSVEEATALSKISATMGLCARAADAKKPLSINPAGLRAMLATAAFRSIAAMSADVRS
jgi:hypothetical protein